MTLLLIGAAGAAGVLARYGLSQISASLWTTCAINVAGSLLLGILIHAGRDLSPEMRDTLGAGLLGGFTTFSTFSVQAVLESEVGRPATAALYVASSVVLGLGAAAVGYYGARGI